jgi:histidyl-tRNA synthetase
MREANKHDARYVIIVGETELAAGKVTVRPLDSGEQVEVLLDEIVDWVRQKVGR